MRPTRYTAVYASRTLWVTIRDSLGVQTS
jgi:hypothetical protein